MNYTFFMNKTLSNLPQTLQEMVLALPGNFFQIREEKMCFPFTAK